MIKSSHKLVFCKEGMSFMKQKERIIYYDSLKDDDFSGTNIEVKPLRDNYTYVHKNPFWILAEACLYYIIAKPAMLFTTKFICHQKFANKKLIKQAKKTGAILYGNHTTFLADSFAPHLLFPLKKTRIIVSPETMSIRGIQRLLAMLGVMPLTEKLSLKKKFLHAMRHYLNKRKLILIYPEAHIWPYYTKIRPFDDASFKYAALFDKPVYTITNCYQKRKFGKKPKIITYLDGPFYPNPELSTKENAAYLRDICYKAMVDRTEKYSTYEYIKYIQREKEDEKNQA